MGISPQYRDLCARENHDPINLRSLLHVLSKLCVKSLQPGKLGQIDKNASCDPTHTASSFGIFLPVISLKAPDLIVALECETRLSEPPSKATMESRASKLLMEKQLANGIVSPEKLAVCVGPREAFSSRLSEFSGLCDFTLSFERKYKTGHGFTGS